jgi:hypothetical protein
MRVNFNVTMASGKMLTEDVCNAIHASSPSHMLSTLLKGSKNVLNQKRVYNEYCPKEAVAGGKLALVALGK